MSAPVPEEPSAAERIAVWATVAVLIILLWVGAFTVASAIVSLLSGGGA